MKADNLTEDQILVKIAEACGWRKVGPKGFGSLKLVGIDPKEPAWPFSLIPNYPADLNACAEFEKTMTREQLMEYEHYLARVCGWSPLNMIPVYCATARQRCIAFIETLP